MSFVWVFLGGGLGAVSRYGLVQSLAQETTRLGLPLGVFVVNLLGCLALGFAAHWALKHIGHEAWARFLMIGFLGGFTTFSTFALDAINLIQSGQILVAMAYALGSVVLGMVAVLLGFCLAQALLGT